MDQKIIFREMLSEIREKAALQGRRIPRSEVEAFFAHAGLTDEQLDMVCNYLEEQHIEVTDQSEETPGELNGEPDEERESALERFLQEVEETRAPQAAQELQLFHNVVAGDAAAREQLAQLYLQTVCSLAAEYEEEGLPAEDLIQEGSVGLMMALDALTPLDSLAAYRTKIFNEINQYLEKVIREHKAMEDAGGAALRKVQRLDEAMQSLMEELGRKVTAEELSAFLEMPLSELMDIARLAGNELEFAGSETDIQMPWEL